MRHLRIGVAVLISLLALSPAQSGWAQTPSGELPALEHFSASIVDHSANPCDDFYQYADSKWLSAHPIPADQPGWGVEYPLQLWNETLLRATLEKASVAEGSRTPNEQKVGDFYYACMDEKNINVRTQEWLKPELERINAIRDKSDIATEVAHLHQTIPGAWIQGDDQTEAALLGFSGLPDYDDASRDVAQFDQGGMGLPGRSFYLDRQTRPKKSGKSIWSTSRTSWCSRERSPKWPRSMPQWYWRWKPRWPRLRWIPWRAAIPRT